MSIKAYPLAWPIQKPRIPGDDRKRSAFGRDHRHAPSVAMQTRYIIEELGRLGVHDDDIVISTNVRLRLDGLPRSGQAEPDDPAAAVYWQIGESHFELGCDQYDRVACNLRAIFLTIEAQRAITRWGCITSEQAFRGYVAIESEAGGEPWWETLGFDAPTADAAEIHKAFRAKAREHHPDMPNGNAEAWDRLQRATAQGVAHTNG